jgi:hypothetical protein
MPCISKEVVIIKVSDLIKVFFQFMSDQILATAIHNA